MIKSKTLKKQEFSLKNIPKRKILDSTKLITHSPELTLKDKNIIFNALWMCLIEQDIVSFKEILKAHLDVLNKTQLATKSKTSLRTLHRILAAEGNPTLKSISKVLNALYG